MREKIIIENTTDMPMTEVLSYVNHVVSGGKVSETSKGKQYCFVTSWTDGTVVYVSKNAKSERFYVYKETP